MLPGFRVGAAYLQRIKVVLDGRVAGTVWTMDFETQLGQEEGFSFLRLMINYLTPYPNTNSIDEGSSLGAASSNLTSHM